MVKGLKVGPYELGRELGRGATGTVFEATDPCRNVTVAVKILKLSQTSKKSMLHEIKVMKDLGHENTVRFFTVFHEKATSYLVLEIVGGGELFDTVVKWKRDTRERLTFHYFFQLMSGVKYLHKAGYAHRDLKLENLLLSKDGILKIADFGVSKELVLHPMRTCCGSPDYIAPEVLGEKNGYNGQLADIWSCGVILYTMICGEFPFENTQHIMQAKYKVPRWCPKLAKESCIDKILVVDPSKRLQSADAVLETEWCGTFSARKNSFGMLRNILFRRLKGPRARLRRIALEVIIKIKVIGAFSRASFKGAPRDIRSVTSDRLKSVLRVLTTFIKSTTPHPPNRTNSFGSDSSFKAASHGSPLNQPRSTFGRKVLNIGPFGKKWFSHGSQKSIAEEKEVNWKGLRSSSEYVLQMRLLQEVERADVSQLSNDELLAVYLNMYHLMMINGFVVYGKHLCEMTEDEGKNFFDDITYIIAYSQMSLNDLHHGILRCNGKLPHKGFSGFFAAETQFDPKIDQEKIDMMLSVFEPRTHFALSTLSVSSSRILIYEAATVQSLLAKITQDYFDEHVYVDLEQHALRLPLIFSLFSADFGANKNDMLNWIRDHLSDNKKKDFSVLMERGSPGITYLPFLSDWNSIANERFEKPENWRFGQDVENEIIVRADVKGSRKIDVTIVEASHLPKMDLIDSVDTYCILSLNDAKFESSVRKGTFQPDWQEKFSFNVADINDKISALHIQIMQWNDTTPSEAVGEVTVSAGRMQEILHSDDGWEEDCVRHIMNSGKSVLGYDKQLSTLRLQIRANKVEMTHCEHEETQKNSRKKRLPNDSGANSDDKKSVSSPRGVSGSPTLKKSSPSSPRSESVMENIPAPRGRRVEESPVVRKSKSPVNRARRRSSIDVINPRELVESMQRQPHFLQKQPKSRSSGDLLRKEKKEWAHCEMPVRAQRKDRKTKAGLQELDDPTHQVVSADRTGTPVDNNTFQTELFRSLESSEAHPPHHKSKKKSASKRELLTTNMNQEGKIAESPQEEVNLPGIVTDTSERSLPLLGTQFSQDVQGHVHVEDFSRVPSAPAAIPRLISHSPDMKRQFPISSARDSFNIVKWNQDVCREALTIPEQNQSGQIANESKTDLYEPLADIPECPSGKNEEIGEHEMVSHGRTMQTEELQTEPNQEIEACAESASPSRDKPNSYQWNNINEIVEIMADGWKQPEETVRADENTDKVLRDLTSRISLRKLSLTAEQVLEGEARRKLIGSYDYNAAKEKQPEIKVRYSAKKKKNRSSCSIL